MGKIRCPLRPPSMTLDRDRPEILTPLEHPQACCTQQTLTVPDHMLAKTAPRVLSRAGDAGGSDAGGRGTHRSLSCHRSG
jgi:hypothetical protein